MAHRPFRVLPIALALAVIVSMSSFAALAVHFWAAPTGSTSAKVALQPAERVPSIGLPAVDGTRHRAERGDDGRRQHRSRQRRSHNSKTPETATLGTSRLVAAASAHRPTPKGTTAHNKGAGGSSTSEGVAPSRPRPEPSPSASPTPEQSPTGKPTPSPEPSPSGDDHGNGHGHGHDRPPKKGGD